MIDVKRMRGLERHVPRSGEFVLSRGRVRRMMSVNMSQLVAHDD